MREFVEKLAEIAVNVGILKGTIEQLEKENDWLKRENSRLIELLARGEGTSDEGGRNVNDRLLRLRETTELWRGYLSQQSVYSLSP